MSILNKDVVKHLDQPFFFGKELGIARTETVAHKQFEDLVSKQLSFFWRPEEVNLSKDIIDYKKLREHEQHMFLANLKYQTLLDSIQGRAPNVAFLPICSDPALERWIETWSFSETIHSSSYMHIIRTVLPDTMSQVFDSITLDDAIMKRAAPITKYYDELIKLNAMRELISQGYKISAYNEREHKKALYLCMMSVNILEAIRFYVSFAVTFSFGEQKLMMGNAEIISFIARDEALHLKGTQYVLRSWQRGKDTDPEMQGIAEECYDECVKMFLDASKQEKEWAAYLMQLGPKIGLNERILCEYVDYITAQRMRSVGLQPTFTPPQHNPIPWINNWLKTENVQVAPQETEIGSYLSGDLQMSDLDDSLVKLEI